MKNFKYSILKDFILVIRQSDGSVVWLGAVCVGVGEFFASPGKRTQGVPSR